MGHSAPIHTRRSKSKSKNKKRSFSKSKVKSYSSNKKALLNELVIEGSVEPFLEMEWEEQQKYNKDVDFILELLKLFPTQTYDIATSIMDDSLRHDKKFLLLALYNTEEIMRYATYELFTDRDFILKARRVNPRSLLYMPRETFNMFPYLTPVNVFPRSRGYNPAVAHPVLSQQNMFNVAGKPHGRTRFVQREGLHNANAVAYKVDNWLPGHTVWPDAPYQRGVPTFPANFL
jgi:hypothetical protein